MSPARPASTSDRPYNILCRAVGKRRRARPPSMWLTQPICRPLRVTRSITGLNQLRQCSVPSPHTAERALCGAPLPPRCDVGELILATVLEFHKFPGELRTNFDFGEYPLRFSATPN